MSHNGTRTYTVMHCNRLDSLVLGIGGEEMLLNDLATLRVEVVKLLQVSALHMLHSTHAWSCMQQTDYVMTCSTVQYILCYAHAQYVYTCTVLFIACASDVHFEPL
jgi:hypothetical protein